MEKKELKELCETWTEYMQCNSGSLHEGYMLDDDKVCYITDDAEVLESSEEKLIEDINTSFEDFFRNKTIAWIQFEYIEEVLGIDYNTQQPLVLEIAELIYAMGSPRREEYCLRKIKDKYDDPFQRADYLLQALKD